MIRHLRRSVVAVSGAAVLVLGAGTVAHASVAPPNGPPAGTTVQQAQDGASGTPDYIVPAPPPNPSGASHRSSRPTTPHAPTTVAGPAPISNAHADALHLEFLQTCVACTGADAGATSSHGHATAIRLLGHDVAGGDSVSNGSHDGALLALPVNPLLNLAIADWRTTSGASDTATSSHSHAALLDLALLGERPSDSLLTLTVLESTSNATYTDALSHGDADSNGVVLTLVHGGLVIVLLHSQTSSDHSGWTYILSINGNALFTNAETGGCDGLPITIPGLLTLHLLQVCAVGGTAGVGSLSVPSGATETAGVVTAQSDGAATVAAPATIVPPATGGVAAAAATAVPVTAGASSVPSTGVNLGVGGLLLVLAGTTVAVLAMRRRRASS
jgi:hypothetical protein